MLYSDIIDYPRPWNREKYPVLAHLEIEAEQHIDFERKAADQTQVCVLGHDEGSNGCIVMHVGCTTELVQRRLASRWASV